MRGAWYWPAKSWFRLTGKSGDKRVIVHVGVHKTGTLAFQEELRAHQIALRVRGIYFDWHQSRLLAMQLREQSPLPPAELDRQRQVVQDLITRNPEPIVIISKEDFAGNPLKGYGNIVDVLNDLKTILKPWPVDIAVCFRRQDAFFESLYSQFLKGGGIETFAEFRRSADDQSFEWPRVISALSDAFGHDRVRVRVFDDLPRESGQLVDAMLEGMIPALRLRSRVKQPQNLGYSLKAMEIAALANRSLAPREQKLMRRFLESTIPKQPGEATALYTPEERRDLLAHYLPSNEILFRKHLNRPVPESWRPESVRLPS